ncbi:hypothetical protein ANO14919_071230 [Xylariales sp. No.14919]|nr:hypothetical protein ANO14919_071230 [Xylariales sp. No.14919]
MVSPAFTPRIAVPRSPRLKYRDRVPQEAEVRAVRREQPPQQLAALVGGQRVHDGHGSVRHRAPEPDDGLLVPCRRVVDGDGAARAWLVARRVRSGKSMM